MSIQNQYCLDEIDPRLWDRGTPVVMREAVTKAFELAACAMVTRVMGVNPEKIPLIFPTPHTVSSHYWELDRYDESVDPFSNMLDGEWERARLSADDWWKITAFCSLMVRGSDALPGYTSLDYEEMQAVAFDEYREFDENLCQAFDGFHTHDTHNTEKALFGEATRYACLLNHQRAEKLLAKNWPAIEVLARAILLCSLRGLLGEPNYNQSEVQQDTYSGLPPRVVDLGEMASLALSEILPQWSFE